MRDEDFEVDTGFGSLMSKGAGGEPNEWIGSVVDPEPL